MFHTSTLGWLFPALVILEMETRELFAQAGLKLSPPRLSLPSSQGYRCEPPVPTLNFFFLRQDFVMYSRPALNLKFLILMYSSLSVSYFVVMLLVLCLRNLCPKQGYEIVSFEE
jgi:hypothetical protein